MGEVNQFLAKYFGKVITLYNEVVRIETTELRKGMEKESGIIQRLHTEFQLWSYQYEREMKEFKDEYSGK